MDPAPLLDRILDDEGLIAGLDEPEASYLIATLSARVRKLAAGGSDESTIRRQVEELCRTARKVTDVVSTFRDAGEAVARTTAARHGLSWPAGATSPMNLVQMLLPLDQDRG